MFIICWIEDDNKLIDLVGQEGAENAINLIFALSLMGDIPTNKARMSDNAQQQSASNAVPILFINSKYT